MDNEAMIGIRSCHRRGKIKLVTLVRLGSALKDIDRDYHVEIIVHPKVENTSLIKTIDNEKDAKQTLENIKKYQVIKGDKC